MFLVAQKSALAAAFPLSGVTLFLKSITSLQVISANTDINGYFNTTVKEENGAYNIFVGDENMPPVKIVAKNGIVSGRILILTEGTTTKDPAPVAPKKPAPVKKIKNATTKIKKK